MPTVYSLSFQLTKYKFLIQPLFILDFITHYFKVFLVVILQYLFKGNAISGLELVMFVSVMAQKLIYQDKENLAHKNLLLFSNDNLREVMSAFHLIGSCDMIIFPEIPFAFKRDTVVY